MPGKSFWVVSFSAWAKFVLLFLYTSVSQGILAIRDSPALESHTHVATGGPETLQHTHTSGMTKVFPTGRTLLGASDIPHEHFFQSIQESAFGFLGFLDTQRSSQLSNTP